MPNMNSENLKCVIKSVDNQLFELINHLICSICHELLNESVSTPCGHSFCKKCIRRVVSSKDNNGCPLCKSPVNRYKLEDDKVKSTLAKICSELPEAFKKDIEDLSRGLKDTTEDFTKNTKLARFYNQESVKDTKTKRRKSLKVKLEKTSDVTKKEKEENETESFFPVLKRNKKVIEYASAKRKKLDDLVSISQTEPVSSLSLGGPPELDKNLKNIEKLSPEVKVKEWFEAVGDNIYINSPNSSLLESLPTEQRDPSLRMEKNDKPSGMIRRDYNKSVNTSNLSRVAKNITPDPYEFIPSQRNLTLRKRKSRKSVGKQKKIPDFESLQSFTKESIKRNAFINKELEVELEVPSRNEETQKNEKNLITASQKFDKLLQETKEKEKRKTPKRHTLYSVSRTSSPNFLDCSLNSGGCAEKKTPLRTANLSSDEESSKNVELFTSGILSEKLGRRKRSKRGRSFEVGKSREKRKKLMIESSERNTVNNISRNNTESSLKSPQEKVDKFETKLMKLLRELINDEIIYPKNDLGSKNLLCLKNTENEYSSDLDSTKKEKPIETLTQNTILLGFPTQVESPEVSNFKNMVANMEEKLKSEENEIFENLQLQKNQKIIVTEKKQIKEDSLSKAEEVDKKSVNPGIESELLINNNNNNKKESCNLEKNESKNLVPFNLMGKIKKNKTSFVEFVRLGRLTPTTKRSKSSVVKLVFPIGLSSLARRHSFQNKFAVGVQTSQTKYFSPSSASASVQTSQKMVSTAFVQTSQAVKSSPPSVSAFVQTSQDLKSCPSSTSTLVQTSQKILSTSSVQTSQVEKSTVMIQTSQQKNFSVEIQTSQIPFESAEVQISQTLSENSNKENWCEREKGMIEFSISDENMCRKDYTSKTTRHLNNNTKETTGRKVIFSHNKIVNKNKCEDEPEIDLYSILNENESPKRSRTCTTQNDMLVTEIRKEFEDSWVRNSEKKDIKIKNKTTENEKIEEVMSDDSDIRPPPKREKPLKRILSGESVSSVDRYMVPLDVKKVTQNSENFEVIDLGTSREENSEEQMLKVLKNIDLDLMKDKKEENVKVEKSEESDSDFFVEQTPPRPRIPEPRSDKSRKSNTKPVVLPKPSDSEGTDVITDSIPKALLETESFLMLSAPEKILITPRKSQQDDVNFIDSGKKTEKDPSFLQPIEDANSQKIFTFRSPKPNENDQNQLNADITNKAKIETKSSQMKNIVEAWKRPELSQRKLAAQQKKHFCVVASSVKNPETIKKFVSKFKMEYSIKPRKDMTHLIVGLHENEEGELLPLCTPKLLFAMANKKWVVSESWVEACLEKNQVVPEEQFETLDPVGGPGCRNARMSTEPLLANCEIFLLGTFQTISKGELADLILDCGGTLVPKPEKFSFSPFKLRMIIVDKDSLKMNEKQLQELHEKHSTVILSRDVIIMSIQSFKLANFFPYLLHLASEENLVKMGYPPSLVCNEEEEEEEENESCWTTMK